MGSGFVYHILSIVYFFLKTTFALVKLWQRWRNLQSIEFEQEQERGGEVELEQFWIQKSFGRFANIRAGHIVVPVGLTNAYHEPLNFFTVYRPEGENTILPCTWHQTGVSFWGHAGDFRYD